MAAGKRRVLMVRVKPRSSASVIEQAPSGEWIARLRSAPVDGKANTELIALVAEHFGYPRSAVTIRTGASARLKRIEVEGA